MARVLVCALALAAGACKPTGDSGSSPPPPAAPSSAPAGTHAASSGSKRCDGIEAALRAELAKLPSACTSDGDCTCYVGGVSGVTGCGGISDLAAAKRIGELTREYQEAKCDGRVDCAARLCQPACVDGHCRERLPKRH